MKRQTKLKPQMIYQKLTVKGARLDLEAFRRKMDGYNPMVEAEKTYKKEESVFCFHNVIPVPEAAVNQKYIDVICDVRKAIWGCETDAWEAKLRKEGHHFLVYTYLTHQALPIKVLEKLVIDHPELSFELEFDDERIGLYGKGVSRDGRFLIWQKNKFAHERQRAG